MLRTASMGTDFDVLLNPDGPPQQLAAASDALAEVSRLEAQYSVYRDDSELSQLNRDAVRQAVPVEPRLFGLLQRACQLARDTEGAFNPAAGRLIRCWRGARRAERVPGDEELAAAVAAANLDAIAWDAEQNTIRFEAEGPQFDLGGIGKGYAVDEAAELLISQGVENWLVHGGKSSARVLGGHAGHDGWPIALHNPLLPERPFLTLLLNEGALSTTGTAVQWFRQGGKRYGHVLDPRTGWPVEHVLSVSVIAPDAATADALSTAFFVLGVESALRYCDNLMNVGLILFPQPEDGRSLEPILHNIPPDRVFRTAPP